MHRLIASAPFGNWIQHSDVTSTVGTYTVSNRAGFKKWRLWWKVASTLRRYRKIQAWTNKLGLPSPGLEYLKSLSPAYLAGKIFSIHGFDQWEWAALLHFVKLQDPKPEALELNVSCPNVGELSVPASLFRDANHDELGCPVIVKLPPVNWEFTFETAYDAGIRNFHCCNTLPTPCGGMSGKPLKAVSLGVIREIRRRTRSNTTEERVKIIGGGGITEPRDIANYYDAGADYFAVGSGWLKFRYLFRRARVAFIDRLYEAIDKLTVRTV